MATNDPDVCEVTDKTCFVQAREQSDVKKHILQTSCKAKFAMPQTLCLSEWLWCFFTDEIWVVRQNLDAGSFSLKSEASCVQLLCIANFALHYNWRNQIKNSVFLNN
jgi:hypothetical protein